MDDDDDDDDDDEGGGGGIGDCWEDFPGGIGTGADVAKSPVSSASPAPSVTAIAEGSLLASLSMSITGSGACRRSLFLVRPRAKRRSPTMVVWFPSHDSSSSPPKSNKPSSLWLAPVKPPAPPPALLLLLLLLPILLPLLLLLLPLLPLLLLGLGLLLLVVGLLSPLCRRRC